MALVFWVLALSAVPFAVVGIAFLAAPNTMGALAGLSLAGATAHADVRAVYGGLQLGCAALLGWSAASPSRYRSGLVALLLLYGGLCIARLLSYTISGLPSPLGYLLHAGEVAALIVGFWAWRVLGRELARSAAQQAAPIDER